MMVMMIYFAVLLMQRDPNIAYSMESTIVAALFTSDTGHAPCPVHPGAHAEEQNA